MDRFCELLGIQRKAPNPEVMPEENEQIKVSDLAEMLKMYNPSQLADAINNRQRTDTKKDSILKTQAFYEYMEVFRQFKVDTYQDLNDIVRGNPKFEASLRVIRGQANVAVTYFLMLAGDVNGVKVDTQLTRFAQNAVGRRMNQEEISDLFKRAAEYYSQNGYPDMTPRHLDHIVWNWQRAR
jgi:inner membrane protein involved in colicin E2 resistance